MNAVVHRGKVAVARTLCHPSIGRLVGRLFRNRIPSRGCVIDVRDPIITASIKASVFFGFYESAEVRFVQRYLPSNVDVVELGASLGVVSAQVARRLAAGRRLVCVEANAALLPALENNVRTNSKGVDLTTLHGAIDYASSGRRIAFLNAEEHIYSRLAGESESAATISVPRVRLNEVVEGCGLGEYVLVSDIEGAEAGLIQNDKPALRGCQMIIAELHATMFKGRHFTVDDLVRDLEAQGFVVVDRHGPVCVFTRTSRA